MTWNYTKPDEPASEEVAKENNGKALEDLIDPATGAVVVKKGCCSVRSRNCAMTVRRPAAAGFSPVAGRRKAT